MEIEILYEDKDIVALNKPAGLVVHSDGRTVESTVADWVFQKYPGTTNVGEPSRNQKGEIILRPGIVHRLDRDTSGVMLVAKTSIGFDSLKKQFQDHQIRKEYHLFVYGTMPDRINGVVYPDGKSNRGLIERPIGRSAQDFRLWSAQRGAKGEMREAITEFEVMARGETGDEKYSFVHAFPKTGRTHQIRVHFKAVHYPLVADILYAPERTNALGFTRLALHSYSIMFLTTDGKTETVRVDEPVDFIEARKRLQN